MARYRMRLSGINLALIRSDIKDSENGQMTSKLAKTAIKNTAQKRSIIGIQKENYSENQ
jgi:hypothetical protein